MVKKLSETEAKKVLGVAGDNTYNGQIRADELLPELRGKKAIRKYREMRKNCSTRQFQFHSQPRNASRIPYR